MKSLVLIFILTLAGSGAWSQDNAYLKFLSTTRELTVGDSLRLDELSDGIRLDTSIVKQFFSPLLTSGNNKFKNRTYSSMGRISGNDNFYLFMVREDRRRADSTGMMSAYLVTLKKTGDYISSQKVGVTGTKKKSGYNIRSTLYKDNRIFIDSRIMTGEKLFEEIENYRISKTGRFILEENDK